MTDDERESVLFLVDKANMALQAVIDAMNDDDMESFDRYLKFYAHSLSLLKKTGAAFTIPQIEFVPDKPN